MKNRRAWPRDASLFEGFAENVNRKNQNRLCFALGRSAEGARQSLYIEDRHFKEEEI